MQNGGYEVKSNGILRFWRCPMTGRSGCAPLQIHPVVHEIFPARHGLPLQAHLVGRGKALMLVSEK